MIIQLLNSLLALILTAIVLGSVSLKHTVGDFDVYFSTGQHFLAKTAMYIPHGGIEEFKYAPFFACCFAPLTLLGKLPALYCWTILNLLSVFGIFYIFYRLGLIDWKKSKDFLLLLCLFALTGRFLIANLKLGQVNTLLCFLMVLTMYYEINKKYFSSALFLSLALMIKFFPLVFVLYYVFTGRFKLLGYMFLMIAVFLCVPALYTGFAVNGQYLNAWLVLLKSSPPVLLYSPKNYSLLSFFSWFFIVRHEHLFVFDYVNIKKALTPFVYYAWGIASALFLAVFYHDLSWNKPRKAEVIYLEYGALFICALLINPLAYLNALTYLIIPYFFILRFLINNQLSLRYQIFCGFFVVLSFLLTLFDNRIFFADVNTFYAILVLKPLMWTMILLYISLFAAKKNFS